MTSDFNVTIEHVTPIGQANAETDTVSVAMPAAAAYGRFSFPLDMQIQSGAKIQRLELHCNNYLHESLAPANALVEGSTHRHHFVGEISVLGLPEDFLLICSAVYGDNSRRNLLRIAGKRRRLAPAAQPLFQPVAVNGIPRSGTTLMMGLLSSHSSFVTKAQYPFEHRPALYWAHQFQALSRPNNEPGGMRNWDFETDRRKIGAFTYYTGVAEIQPWIQETYIPGLAAFCVKNIDEVYALLRDAQQKTSSTHFVEKFPGWKGRYFAELYASYTEVVIVRDIRDVFCSVRGFNKRRGKQDFGVENFKTDGEYLTYLGNLLNQMASKKKESDSRTKIHIVRYEEIMQDPIAVFSKLFEEIGLAVDARTTADLERAMKSPELNNLDHRTGSVSDGGIGRWKNELDSKLIKEVAERSGALLTSLGYEV